MKENTNIKITGQITDKIIHLDTGEVEVREGHNIVVNTFTKLVMSLLGRTTGYKGITYWAVGSGLPAWDSVPVSPTLSESTLTAEVGRKIIEPTNMTFLHNRWKRTRAHKEAFDKYVAERKKALAEGNKD